MGGNAMQRLTQERVGLGRGASAPEDREIFDMMKTKAMMMALALAGFAGLAACEKAGESVDNAIDDVRGKKDAGDGAFEKTGEAVDHTLGIERKDDAVDSIGDAIDGDPKTKPN